MKRVLILYVVLCIFTTQCQELGGSSSKEFDAGTGNGLQDIGDETTFIPSNEKTQDQGNKIQLQLTQLTPGSRSRSSQNRLQAALLRARLRQITIMTSKQVQTENYLKNELAKLKRRPRWSRCYSCGGDYSPNENLPTDLANNYAISQVYYLQRTVGKMTATVRKMGLNADRLEEWKQISEERMAKMENAIELLQRQNVILQDSYPDDGISESHHMPGSNDLKNRRSLLDEYVSQIEELQNAVLRVNQSVEDIRVGSFNKREIPELQTAKVISNPHLPELQHLQTSEGDSYDFADLLQSSLDHAAAITNLSQVVSQQEETIQQQKSSIQTLQNQLLMRGQKIEAGENKNAEQDAIINTLRNFVQDRSNITSEIHISGNLTTTIAAPMASVDEVREISQTVEELRQSLRGQDKIVKRLYARVGNMQRCCRSTVAISRKIAGTERRIKEVKTRADAALKTTKIEKRKMESLNIKIEAQRQVTKRLQSDLRNRDQIAAHSNQRFLELLQNHQETLNETLNSLNFNSSQLQDSHSHKLEEIEMKMLQNIDDLKYLTMSLDAQIHQLNITQHNIYDMELMNKYNHFSLQKNITDIFRRIGEKEKNLVQQRADIGQMQTSMEGYQRNLQSMKFEVKEHMDGVITNVRENTKSQLQKHSSELLERMLKLENNVTELSTKSKFVDNQMIEFHSLVAGIESLDEITENDMKILTSRINQQDTDISNLKRALSKEISDVKSSATSCCDATAEVVASINVTFEEYRFEQEISSRQLIQINEQHNSMLSGLKKNTTNIENQQSTITANIDQLNDVMSGKLTSVNEKIEKVEINLEQLRNNASNFNSIVTNLQTDVSEKFTTTENEISQQRSEYKHLKKETTHLKNVLFVKLNASVAYLIEKDQYTNEKVTELATIKIRLNGIKSEVEESREKINSQEVNISTVNSLITVHKEGFEEAMNDVKNSMLILKSSVEDKNDEILNRIMSTHGELTNKTLQNKQKMSLITMQFNGRIAALEKTNASVQNDINKCINKMTAVDDGLKQLMNADNVVSEALESHQNALTKHDHLHRNLSAISDEFQEVMNDQGVALEKISEIMKRLNESFVEGQDVIDESLRSQFHRQEDELATMRSAMQNFSLLITNVMKDQLSHDVAHVNLQSSYKSLMETLDSHDVSISEVTSKSSSNEKNVETLQVECDSNTKQLQNLVLEIDDNERRLHTLNMTSVECGRSIKKLDKTLKTNENLIEQKIFNISTKLSFLDGQDQIWEGKLMEYKNEMNQEFESFQSSIQSQNITLENAIKISENISQQNSIQSNQIDTLVERTQTIYVLKSFMQNHQNLMNTVVDSLLVVENGLSEHSTMISDLSQKMETVGDNITSINENINTLNASITSPAQPDGLLAMETMTTCPCNEDIMNKQEKKMLDLTEKLLKLDESNELLEKNMEHMTNIHPEMRNLKEQAKLTHSKLDQHEMTLKMLNNSAIMSKSDIHGLRKAAVVQSGTLQSMQRSSTDIVNLVQRLQSDILQHGTKLETFTSQLQEEKRKISFLKSSMTSSDSRISSNLMKLTELTHDLQYNVSLLEDDFAYLQYDVESNFNSTQNAFEMINGHDTSLSTLSSETNAFVSSIASSVASLDNSMQDINSTLSYKVKDTDELLVDFQLAFDTSNRQLARTAEEMNIFMENTTNHVQYFSTSIDYLTQIIHETTEAMEENSERINLINETMLFIRLSVPGLLATGVKDGLFEMRNSTRENPLFSLKDLASESLQRGDAFLQETHKGYGNSRKDNNRIDNDLDSVLNGDADEMRINHHVESMIADDPSESDDDYLENYDFGSLERRKRVVNEVRRIGHQIDSVENLIQHLQSSVYEIGNSTLATHQTTQQIELANEDQNNKVIFSSGLTEKFPCCGTVKFDKVFINIGGGYDPTTGRFSATRSGHYAFFVSISERNKYVNAAIVMNGMAQVTVRMDHNTGDYEQSQSTNSVILSLKTGDEVWVQTYSGSLLGYQYPAVTFSGFLVA